MDFADEITLTGLRVFGHHGVYAEEKRDGQVFVVDLTMYVDMRTAAASDDVVDTVHYGEVADEVAAIVSGEPVDLLETLATRIADHLLTKAPVGQARVTVHKPSAPIAVPFSDVAVTIVRRKSAR